MRSHFMPRGVRTPCQQLKVNIWCGKGGQSKNLLPDYQPERLAVRTRSAPKNCRSPHPTRCGKLPVMVPHPSEGRQFETCQRVIVVALIAQSEEQTAALP